MITTRRIASTKGCRGGLSVLLPLVGVIEGVLVVKEVVLGIVVTGGIVLFEVFTVV